MVLRRLTLAIAILSVVSTTYPVMADGWDHPAGEPFPLHRHGHDGDWGHGGRGDRDRNRGDWPEIDGGGYGVPSVIPGLGTFAGSVSALRIRGHGTYFYAEGLGAEQAPAVRVAPMAKVVDATKGPACSYEGGVCVIRP